jgi:hypothetical protein
MVRPETRLPFLHELDAYLRIVSNVSSRAHSNNRAREILDKPSEMITTEDIRELRTLMYLVAPEFRLPAPDEVKVSSERLKQIVTGGGVITDENSVTSEALRTMRLSLDVHTRDEAIKRFKRLLRTPPIDMTDQHVREMRALALHLPEGIRIGREEAVALALQAKRQVLEIFLENSIALGRATHAMQLARHISSTPSRAVNAMNTLWNRRTTSPHPDWDRLLWIQLSRTAPAAHPQTLEQSIASLEQYAAFAGASESALPAIATFLKVIERETRTIGADVSAPQMAHDIANNVAELANKNIRRIDGEKIPTDTGEEGYEHFPDYGEIGELIAGARMLEGTEPPSEKSVVTW